MNNFWLKATTLRTYAILIFVKSGWYGSTGTVGELFREKFVQFWNLFGLWPNFLGSFCGKIAEALLKRNFTTPVQRFQEKFFWKNISASIFFEFGRIIGLRAEGTQQDAKTTFYVIRETFRRKLFEKMLFWLNCFFPWAKNSGPSGRNFLTA